MKNQPYLLLILLLVVQLTIAQQDSISPYKYGIQAGINLATFTEDQDFENRLGLNASLFASYKLPNSQFSLTSGLLYSQQGVKQSGSTPNPADGPDLIYEATLKLDYLKVPVFLEYEIVSKASVFIGPQIGLLVGNKVVYDFEDNGFNLPDTYEAELENVQELSLSATLGTKIFLYKNAFVQAQYELGLYGIFKDNQFPQDGNRTFSYEDFRHSILTFSLGYQF